MKKLIVLAVAAMFATSAFAGDMKWNGGTGMRYSSSEYNDGLSSNDANGKDRSKQMKKDWAYKANVGATGGSGDVEYGFDIRTATAANNPYINYNNAGDGAIALSQAWFSYNHDFGVVDLTATFGRQKNVFMFDKAEQIFNGGVNFDGFGWQFKMGSFGLNAAQYIIGAHTANNTVGSSTYTKTDSLDNGVTTQNKFAVLYGFQPHMNWKFSDEISTKLAVAFYNWNNVDNNSNQVGGYNSATLNTSAVSSTYRVANPLQWAFTNSWDLPYTLAFNGEYVMNKKNFYPDAAVTEVSNKALSLGLSYGKVKKAHDWSIGYMYGDKGLAASINGFASEKFLADNTGHTVNVDYKLADNFNLGFKAMWLKQKDKKNSSGVAITTAQEQKASHMEFTAGVTF